MMIRLPRFHALSLIFGCIRACVAACAVASIFASATALAAGGGSTTKLSAADAIPAPAFALPAIANSEGTLELKQFAGRVVYVDFWASWCGPCRLSLPALDTLYSDLSAEGFDVVAISVDVVEEDSLDFLERYPVTYPVAIDTEGDIPREYAVNGMPSGYLIDRRGKVREVHIGFKRGDEVALRASIEALLAE